MSRTVFTSLIGLGVVFVTLNGAPGYAALGDCSQPVSDGPTPVSSDCLFILKTATGSEICEPECVCDPNADAGITASDALVCLKKSVGQTVTLACPCAITTTTLAPGACLDNDDCETGEYCSKDQGQCHGLGGCDLQPQACPIVEDPVCGCDGNTYTNACFAAAAGVSVASEGSCGCCL